MSLSCLLSFYDHLAQIIDVGLKGKVHAGYLSWLSNRFYSTDRYTTKYMIVVYRSVQFSLCTIQVYREENRDAKKEIYEIDKMFDEAKLK